MSYTKHLGFIVLVVTSQNGMMCGAHPDLLGCDELESRVAANLTVMGHPIAMAPSLAGSPIKLKAMATATSDVVGHRWTNFTIEATPGVELLLQALPSSSGHPINLSCFGHGCLPGTGYCGSGDDSGLCPTPKCPSSLYAMLGDCTAQACKFGVLQSEPVSVLVAWGSGGQVTYAKVDLS
jgi:hypothetical protein